MIGMAGFPIRQYHKTRTDAANDPCKRHARCNSIFEARVRPAQTLTPRQEEMLGCRLRFEDAKLRRATSSHIARRQIEDTCAIAKLSGANERTAASLFYIIGVCCYSKHVKSAHIFKWRVQILQLVHERISKSNADA